MSEMPKPSRIETEECFVIKSLATGEYIIGHPFLIGANFHSKDIETAIRQFSFRTREECERMILDIEIRCCDAIKQWRMFPHPALKIKEPCIFY